MSTPERHTERRAEPRAQVTQMLLISIPLVLALLVLGASCGGSTGSGDDPGAGISAAAKTQSSGASDTAGSTQQTVSQESGRVDPRDGGFEITMGEWAVAPEANVIRPGLVTLVIANKGTHVHGFELKGESDDSTDLEWRLLQPGETMRVNVRLGKGIYELECYVGEHDDMGMRAMLEVKRGAPLAERTAPSAGTATVDITGFEFQPAVMTVNQGETVKWINDDAAPHTVTEQGGGFASQTLNSNSRFGMTFRRPGTYHYFCAVHPGMKGTVIVKP
jgi:plastocyanin